MREEEDGEIGGGTVDRDEIERFRRLARQWWDEDGPFRPLHRLNPARLQFIRDKLVEHLKRDAQSQRPFAGLRLLDIGAGGGLVAEPMARLGFTVTGLDADEVALAVARAHAEENGLAIEYRAAAAEDLAAEGHTFDMVLALEVAEHASDPALFFAAAAKLVAPGGGLVVSTLNRTPKAWALAIVGAEYLLRWLPRGTHTWEKFLRPAEVAQHLRTHGMRVSALAGLAYAPFDDHWTLGRDLGVNYLLFAIKAK